jgi:hypothetical protein
MLNIFRLPILLKRNVCAQYGRRPRKYKETLQGASQND